jgi:hypothetical protein
MHPVILVKSMFSFVLQPLIVVSLVLYIYSSLAQRFQQMYALNVIFLDAPKEFSLNFLGSKTIQEVTCSVSSNIRLIPHFASGET